MVLKHQCVLLGVFVHATNSGPGDIEIEKKYFKESKMFRARLNAGIDKVYHSVNMESARAHTRYKFRS